MAKLDFINRLHFIGACPFTAAEPKEDIENMINQTADDHPITHGKLYITFGLYFFELNFKLYTDVNLNLNRYVLETKVKKNQDYLETPQLASAMKEGTKIVHSAAENSVFTK